MTKEDEKLVEKVLIWGGAIFAGYMILKNLGGGLASALGADPNSAADVALAQAQAQNAGPNSPFSATFQPWVDFYNNNGPEDANGNVIPMQTFMQNLGSYAGLWDTLDVVALGNIASNLNGWFTSESGRMADLNQIQTQMQMAFIAAWLLYNDNDDLLNRLQGNLFTGMSTADLAAVINRVNNLPVQ